MPVVSHWCKEKMKKSFFALLIAVQVFTICGFSAEAKSAEGIFKVAFVCGQELVDGAEVEILNDSKDVVATIVSGNDGKAVLGNFDQGIYYYRVSSVPEGYSCDTSEKKFAITTEDMEVRKVVNLKGAEEEATVVAGEKNFSLTTESDLRVLSNLTAEDYELMLAGTELAGIGEALVTAEVAYGVNGLYMLGLACEESGTGTSRYARERNNLTGWGAADSNPDGAYYFDSKSECIMHVAERLSINYLTEGGKFFSGYTPRAVDVKYCSNPKHADNIVRCVNDRLEQAGIN